MAGDGYESVNCDVVDDRHGAAIGQVLGIIGDRWNLQVLAALSSGPLRYLDLQDASPGISQRMLTRTLSRLAAAGLVTRTSHPEVPPRVEYELSDLGAGLPTLARPIIEWASVNHHLLRPANAGADVSL